MSELAIPDRQPWERHKGETNPAYTAWILYRDLPAPRSIRKAAERLAETSRRNVETIYGQFRTWSTKWTWDDRAVAFDNYQDRRYLERREGEDDRARRAEAALGAGMTRLALQRMNGDERNNVTAVDANDIDAKDLPAMIMAAVRVSRLSRGEPTDFVKSAISVPYAELQSALGTVVQILMPYIDDDRKAGAIEELQAWGATQR